MAIPQPDGSVLNTPYVRATVTNEHKPASVTFICLEHVGPLPPGQGLRSEPLAVPRFMRDHPHLEAGFGASWANLPRLLQDGLPVTWHIVPRATAGIVSADGSVHVRVVVDLSTGRTLTSKPVWVPVEFLAEAPSS
ncbi:hypothetical protein GCM10010488_14850 [Oerskovia jenensis]